MNREEAQAILDAKLDEYRRSSCADLAAKVGCEEICEATGPSGTTYQMEILVAWDGKPKGDIRVLGSIDDGSFRSAFKPLCSDLVITPEGQEK